MVESAYTTDLKSVALKSLRVRVSPGASVISMETNMEKCVVCNIETDVPVDKPVDLRYHYVEGAGQLCKSCWEKVYKK